MLKSTHRSASAAEEAASAPLPSGWTEHKAPTGHSYYYNAATKQSTYKRPVAEPEEELLIDYNATQPDHEVRGAMHALDEFSRNNTSHNQRGAGHFTGGKSYQDRGRRGHGRDRPKSRKSIPGAEPWVLVLTKFGRRFVHNTETKQSLWKFPSEVMMAVIDMDRVEWEAKKKAETEPAQTPAAQETAPKPQPQEQSGNYDSDSYEEVEVTDDKGEGEAQDPSAKRPRIGQDHSMADAPPGPVEFDEDDIAWQLAQMEQDDGNDEQYYDNPDAYVSEHDVERDDEPGLPFTDEDSVALFRSLLDDAAINPFSTFEKLIDSDSPLVEDPRWVSLPNMSRRREVFAQWSKDRIAEQAALRAAQTAKKADPRVTYLAFLQRYATPKLYWPEFKRKYKKEAEMKDLNFSDKEREKLYREYISKMKMGESDRRKELVALLKSVPKGDLTRQSTMDNLPDAMIKDLRFYVMAKEKRDELVVAHISTLT